MCPIEELLLVWNNYKLWCGNHVSRLASLIESMDFMLYNASSSSRVECMTKNTMAMILERGIQALLEVQAILSSWHDLILTNKLAYVDPHRYFYRFWQQLFTKSYCLTSCKTDQNC
jgi:hypothetical protein